MNLLKTIFTQRYSFKTKYGEEKIHRILNNSKVEEDFGIHILQLRKGGYNIKAKRSYGVGMSGGFSQSIEVYLNIVSDKESSTSVKIYTKPRIDLVTLFLISIIVSGGVLFYSEEIITKIFVPIIMIGTFLWFRLIYRMQEKSIIESLQKVLKLKPHKKAS